MVRRKVKPLNFGVKVILHEIQNVPFANGSFFSEIRCPAGSNTKKFTTTSRKVADFHVEWEEQFEFSLKVYKSSITYQLNSTEMRVTVFKENVGGTRSNKIGFININISLFAGKRESVKNFLLSESKTNTSIRVTICMNQLSGDTIFKVPAELERLSSVHFAAGIQELQRQESLTPVSRDIMDQLNPDGLMGMQDLQRAPNAEGEQRLTSQYLFSVVHSTRMDEEEVINALLSEELGEDVDFSVDGPMR